MNNSKIKLLALACVFGLSFSAAASARDVLYKLATGPGDVLVEFRLTDLGGFVADVDVPGDSGRLSCIIQMDSSFIREMSCSGKMASGKDAGVILGGADGILNITSLKIDNGPQVAYMFTRIP